MLRRPAAGAKPQKCKPLPSPRQHVADLGQRPLARRAAGLQHKDARVPGRLAVRVLPLVRRAVQEPCNAAGSHSARRA